MQQYRKRVLILALFAVLSAGFRLSAQIGAAGSITGVVTDPSGAVIPGATVSATNVATGVKTSRQTTATGAYLISPLPAGEYTITAAATGFQTLVQERVVVDAVGTVRLDITLRVGAATESVTVSAAPPQIEHGGRTPGADDAQ